MKCLLIACVNFLFGFSEMFLQVAGSSYSSLYSGRSLGGSSSYLGSGGSGSYY